VDRYRCRVASALKVNFVGNVDFGDLIALAALGLSLWTLLRPWWSGRKADLEVRSEQYRRIQGDRADSAARFVVKNHGPAEARDVAVSFLHDGQPVNLTLVGWPTGSH